LPAAAPSLTGLSSAGVLPVAFITTVTRMTIPIITMIPLSIPPLSVEEAAARCSPCTARASFVIVVPHATIVPIGGTITVDIITPNVEVRDTVGEVSQAPLRGRLIPMLRKHLFHAAGASGLVHAP
jgi:hypothetical protein